MESSEAEKGAATGASPAAANTEPAEDVESEEASESAGEQELLLGGEAWSPATDSDLMGGEAEHDHVSSSSSDVDLDDFEVNPSSIHPMFGGGAESDGEGRQEGASRNVCMPDNRPPRSTRWPSVGDLRMRELGRRSASSLRRRAMSSYELIRRLKKERNLEEHGGCVNTLHFSECGEVLASSGDDLQVALWDWRRGKTTLKFPTGHTSNVFQAKFMPSSRNMKMVSAARDGKIQRFLFSPGGLVSTDTLVEHHDAAHKIALEPCNPNTFLSCGEDGSVYDIDLRTPSHKKLLTCKDGNKTVRLYSIHTNPVQPQYFATSGSSKTIQVFDRRNIVDNEPLERYTVRNMESRYASVTCVVYSHDGKELLATYNDENIYLFNTDLNRTVPVHCFKGHRNNDTIKGVNFFGPRSEYVVSGSDCGHVFLWEKSTEKVVQLLEADRIGAVNCLEPNPQCMTLATSGLEHDVKIWSPRAAEPTSLDDLETVITRNTSTSARESDMMRFVNMMMENRLHALLRRSRRERRRAEGRLAGQDDSSDDDEDDSDDLDVDDDDDDAPPNAVRCVQS